MRAIAATLNVSTDCPECGGCLAIRRRRSDGNPFIGCTEYPSCRFTAPTTTVEQAMAAEIVALRHEVEAARRAPAQPASDFGRATARLPVGVDDIRALVAWAHPDKHQAGVDAHELAVRLTSLMARAKQNGVR